MPTEMQCPECLREIALTDLTCPHCAQSWTPNRSTQSAFAPQPVSIVPQTEVLRPLKRLLAFADDGTILDVPTRWNPRKVLCRDQTEKSSQEHRYAIKFRRNKVSTAVAISELVCRDLIKLIGLRSLDAALIDVSAALANSYSENNTVEYKIVPGQHFGTLLNLGLATGPTKNWSLLSSPDEIIRIWAADCWFMNIDRVVYGNVMMEPVGSQMHLLPLDQSDCFGGSQCFADGSYAEISLLNRAAESLPLFDRAILELGTEPLDKIASNIQKAAQYIPLVMSRVPNEWWDASGVNQRRLEETLRYRAKNIRTIMDINKWKGAKDATSGGRILDL